jgi:hypothetical protein
MSTHRPKAHCRVGLAAVLLGVSATVKADLPGPEPLQYEVTPFVGYRVGGDFERTDTHRSVKVDDHGSLALAFDVLADNLMQYELFYGRQSTELIGAPSSPTPIKVEYLHLGGTVPLEGTRHLNPYFGGGLGITRLTPDPALGIDNTRFSISLSLGLRVPVSRHVALRFEGRGFLTPVPRNSEFFCRSDQTGALCAVQAHGSVFFQADFLAGAAFAF